MRFTLPAVMVICAGTLAATASPALAAASPSPSPGAGAYTYVRHYDNGQVSSYTYAEQENGTTTTAVARLKSYIREGVGGEQVNWVALTSAGQNLDAQAQAFPPYDLSLDPRDPDGLALPDTQAAGELQGPIDDLGAIYVGLSARVGVDNVHQPGQSYTDPTPLSGNFASATAPVGQDLIQLTTTLTSLSAQRATFTSSYQPPAAGGLALSQPWMDSPVCGSTPNNFELVRANAGQYVALWGCEQFTVTTVVDRGSGRIVTAQMSNSLQLDATACQDEALTKCGSSFPVTVSRTVQLTRD